MAFARSRMVDSPYSWVVCLASFIVNMISDGILFSFGLYYIELMDYFQCGESQPALAFSLLIGLEMAAGPFVSVLVNRYGCRAVAMSGGFLSAIGLFSASFADSIELLIFFYGFVGGIGLSMLYIPSIMIVSLYFEKRRALANGLAMCGSGVGTVLFSFLITWLLQDHTWRSILQILAAMLLQCVVCGAFYRPINTPDNETDASTESGKTVDYLVSNEYLPQKCGNLPEIVISTEHRSDDKDKSPVIRGRSSSLTNHCPSKRESLRTFLLKKEVISHHPELSFIKSAPNLNLTTANSISRPQSHTHRSHLHPLDRKDVFYSGSLMRISQNSEPPSLMTSLDSLNRDIRSQYSSNTCSFLGPLRYLIDCGLMKNQSFLVLVLSCTLWTGQGIILAFVAPLAMQSGTQPSDVSWLYCAFGCSNVIGRIVCGLITDHPRVNSVRLYSCALLLVGIVSMIFPFVTSFAAHLTCIVLFGLCMAFYASLRTIILVDVLGIDRLTNSFGILVTFQGFGFVIGPPFAGLLVDLTSSFITAFVLTGVGFMLAGVICVPLKTLPTAAVELPPPKIVEEIDHQTVQTV